MKKMTKWMMVLLSYAPIATVAVAAQAKANEIEGELQSYRIANRTQGLRSKILAQFQMSSSMDEAKQRYSEMTGLQVADLEDSMANDLELLRKAGLIQYDEKLIVAGNPSEHAG